MSETTSNQPCDYFLHKAVKRLKLVEVLSDNDRDLPICIESFLCAVAETYEEIGQLTSADKQQVSAKCSAAREMCVQCNHDMKGGSFDGTKWKCTAKAVYEGLSQTMNEARCRQILRQLQLCEHNVSDIQKSEFIEIIITNFRRLLGNTARLLEFVYKYIRLGTIKGKKLQDTLSLCSLQLQKCFSLLLHVLEKSPEHCHDAKEYLIQRMMCCLLKVRHLIQDGNEEITEEDLGGGLFILHMDQALSLLAVFDSTSSALPARDDLQDCVHNVLQHAMVMAKVSSQFDFKMICGSSEKILRESEILISECTTVPIDPSVLKLYANKLSDSLEELEQRVCAAVLRLYLQVFCDPFSPLEELNFQCWKNPSPGEGQRTSCDLTNLIAAFDTHTECLTQVALFAIACSNDDKRVLGIRSCLASLESLEPQLVPELSSLYLRHHPLKWDFVRLLVQHWYSEVYELWKHIDGIIDSAALAQVTYDAIWKLASTLKKNIEKQQPQQDFCALVQCIVRKASVFTGQLRATFEEINVKRHPSVYKELDDLFRAVKEGEAALRAIQSKSPEITAERVLKRCELLVSCVQRIQPLLERVVESNAVTSISPDKNVQNLPTDKVNNFLKGINLPSDVDIELDITDTFMSQTTEDSIPNKPASSKFITSFLYTKVQPTHKTPRAVSSVRGSLRSHLFSWKKKQTDDSQNLLQETLCLDVTNILESLSLHSQTFHTPKKATLMKPSCLTEDTFKPPIGNRSGRIQNPSFFSSCSSFLSGDINTPERLKDLLHVQERLDAFKISSVNNAGDSHCRPEL